MLRWMRGDRRPKANAAVAADAAAATAKERFPLADRWPDIFADGGHANANTEIFELEANEVVKPVRQVKHYSRSITVPYPGSISVPARTWVESSREKSKSPTAPVTPTGTRKTVRVVVPSKSESSSEAASSASSHTASDDEPTTPPPRRSTRAPQPRKLYDGVVLVPLVRGKKKAVKKTPLKIDRTYRDVQSDEDYEEPSPVLPKPPRRLPKDHPNATFRHKRESAPSPSPRPQPKNKRKRKQTETEKQPKKRARKGKKNQAHVEDEADEESIDATAHNYSMERHDLPSIGGWCEVVGEKALPSIERDEIRPQSIVIESRTSQRSPSLPDYISPSGPPSSNPAVQGSVDSDLSASPVPSRYRFAEEPRLFRSPKWVASRRNLAVDFFEDGASIPPPPYARMVSETISPRTPRNGIQRSQRYTRSNQREQVERPQRLVMSGNVLSASALPTLHVADAGDTLMQGQVSRRGIMLRESSRERNFVRSRNVSPEPRRER
ncbi:MAG: hypothetical protein M1828_000273 [Chrysothrix sp. TS-e1954]|nr:MAG: hypothetical protein M1828_000273 [Chrysothrix sp. TS-e1954]